MSPQVNTNNPPSNPTAGSAKQRGRTLRRDESLFFLRPDPATYQIIKKNTTKTPKPLEGVARCRDLWFEDGDVIIWAYGQKESLLYRVHRRVLKDSGAEPFCTIVDWDYPSPETSDEIFLDGVWVLKYGGQDPVDVMYVLKWMYEQPSISKRSPIPLGALEVYLRRSEAHFIPAMRRCALEYLWNMLPTSLNYHQRVPSLVEGCYSENPILVYKPYVLYTLAVISAEYQLVAVLPLLYYYIAQWPMDWITDGVPATSMESPRVSVSDNTLYQLPRIHAFTILAGREKLIRMRENKVFNFMEGFTSSGTTLDFPTLGCHGTKRQETGGTCFEWLMRVWFFMNSQGSIARPSALDIMNMGQWTELQKYCCEACGRRVMKHMLGGRDDVWRDIPSAFGYDSWDLVVQQQRNVEKCFVADIC